MDCSYPGWWGRGIWSWDGVKVKHARWGAKLKEQSHKTRKAGNGVSFSVPYEPELTFPWLQPQGRGLSAGVPFPLQCRARHASLARSSTPVRPQTP